MSPSILRIESDEKLPEAADVVVIGGGIVGAAAAYFLAKRKFSVALLEKGNVGGEQSSRNWGWVRRQNRDERELPLSGVALQLWGELGREIGKDLGFRRCGLRYVTSAERALLPAMQRAGAFRFWLSRLWDLLLPRGAALLNAHDPSHFERVLRALRREIA